MLLNNPLIRRYRCSLLRPRQLWIYLAVYLTLVGLMAMITFASFWGRDVFADVASRFRALYFQFLVMNVIIGWFWSVRNSGSAIREEITEKTYDFFRLLPLSAHRKAVGVMLGKNLVAALLGGVTLVMMLFCGALARMSAGLLTQMLVALLALTLALNCAGLLSSTLQTRVRHNRRIGGGVTLLVLFFLIPMVLRTLTFASELSNLEGYLISFYGLRVPVLLLIAVIALYFGAWAYMGVIRRFTHENEPVFTFRGAMLFMAGVEVVAGGTFTSALVESNNPAVVIGGFWLVTALPLIIIPFGAVRSADAYLERAGRGSGRLLLARLLGGSNLLMGAGLFAAWAIGAMIALRVTGLPAGPYLFLVILSGSFYACLWLLLELYVVSVAASPKIGVLLGFLAILYAVLPLILGAVFESVRCYWHSPLGLATLFFTPGAADRVGQISVLLLNAFLCVVPASLVAMRYIELVRLRRRMG